ncbi:hypothetical protein HYO13_11090 [Vibrio parahaemolyticus]|nr:hypothetical protein [Vibrio parahaemolyticus]
MSHLKNKYSSMTNAEVVTYAWSKEVLGTDLEHEYDVDYVKNLVADIEKLSDEINLDDLEYCCEKDNNLAGYTFIFARALRTLGSMERYHNLAGWLYKKEAVPCDVEGGQSTLELEPRCLPTVVLSLLNEVYMKECGSEEAIIK